MHQRFSCLAELISNAYDADASEIEATFHEQNGTPVSIVVKIMAAV